MFYVITVLICGILLIAANMLRIPFSWGELLRISLSVALGIVSIFALDGIFAFVIRRLTPASWYMPRHKIYEVSKKEYKFYQKFGAKGLVRIVPELGGFTNFHKDSVGNVGDTERLERFLYEANCGVVIHLENALFGFLIAFIPGVRELSVWLPIYLVNFVLSILPVFILRFNNYTMLRLYKRSLNKK